MENVLYDLYLAETIISDNYNFSNDSLRKENMLKAIFEKHKINKQEFDTSLVWYVSELDRYGKINEKIIERYSLDEEALKLPKLSLIAVNRVPLIDTASFFLQTPNRLQNRYVFNEESEKLKNINDIRVNFEVLGINDLNKPTLTIYAFAKDTTFVFNESIEVNGMYSKEYTIPSDKKPYRIYGYIELPDKERNKVLFTNFVISKNI